MRCPSSLFVMGLMICLIAAVAINVESAKHNDEAALRGDAFPTVTQSKSPEIAQALDSRILKIGDLPDVSPTNQEGGGALQFINEQEGWLVIRGENKWDAQKKEPVDSGRLWRTRDGGNSWKLVYENSMHNIDQFDFINSETGWMIVWGEMYKTTDGGDTWHPFHQPIPPNWEGRLDDFTFLKDGRHGWVAGGIELPLIREDGEIQWPPTRYEGLSETGYSKTGVRGAIFQTTDGGNTWKRKFVSKWYGEIHELMFVDEHHGVASGIADVLYWKGGRWKPTDSNAVDEYGESLVRSLEIAIGAPTYVPGSFFFLDADTGWLSNNNGYLAKTTDGGRTWNDILNVHRIWPQREWPLQYLAGFYFINVSQGFALDSDGALHETKDGGLSWTKLSTGITFNSMCFSDPQHGWLISERELFQIAP